jgi:hypothetical protein
MSLSTQFDGGQLFSEQIDWWKGVGPPQGS